MEIASKKSTLALAAIVALGGTVAGGTAASAAPKLPVVAGAQSLTKVEKAGTAAEGLLGLGLNFNALNNVNLLNNILNFGSFNNINRGGNNCGCGTPS